MRTLILLGFGLAVGFNSAVAHGKVSIIPENARISIGSKLLRGSIMAGTPIPLSSSVGGAPTFLTDNTLPGLLIHENPADSGENHLITDLVVVNPNSTAVTLWTTIQGPGVPVPPAQAQENLVRLDVPPTSEGNEPRLFYTPFILAPGYSYYISTTVLTGQVPAYLFGVVETFAAAGVLGYGGLIERTGYTIASIPSSTWTTISYESGALTNPVNVSQEPGNNRFSVNAPGIYFVGAYGVFNCDKNASSDRVIYVRFYNETDGQPVTASPFPCNVENNSNNGLWAVPPYFEVPEALVGKWIRQEIGGSTASFSNVEIQKAGINVTRISPTV